jgi:c(7)-type cytochrome triheme protein
MKTRLSVLALAVAASACGYKPVTDGYPAAGKQPVVTFPHSTHVDADVACGACHDMSKATRLDPKTRHVAIPANVTKQKVCGDCHDTEPKLKKAPARDAVYRISFDHADHLKRVQDCKKCHVKLPEQGDKEMPPPPPMAACTSCHHHQQEFAQARCTPCHVDLKGYKPETAFRHEGNWLATHGSLARPSAESCAACHDQTYCTKCHSPATSPALLERIFPEKVEAAFIHRGDYVSRHMVDAGANPASCRSCHGTPFCDACHSANGFSAASPGAKIRPLSHAAGWTNLVDGGRHAKEARRDISACASCHDQRGPTNTCVGCHSASTGRNPHPKQFLDQHKTSDIAKNSMCRDCHR